MNLRRTARTTGLLYLGVAITGLFGFLVVRPRLFVDGDPTATLANLSQQPALARILVALELGIVLTQALTAAWFYRLFSSAEPVAAGGIAAFGLVNAIAVMGSAAMLGTAVKIAEDPFGDAAASVQTLFLVSTNLWGAGNLFFGLWLIPMGACVLRSRWMPRVLGWTLVGGGVGYVLSAFVGFLAPDAQPVADILVLPATVGEFWMIGYLLIRGVRSNDVAGTPGSVAVSAHA